ncbi:hypothetical protein G7Y89_g11472 [Cudoniella acicularis]|uniref:Uncharacterized protein n=1 Tax=Cudoniella acicularis TaxID=354080 RepID=A0A8H4W036_9HELO|nr:hypothetical protein G7Y89_g11472 [Cudoniella acicularis]
MAKDELVAESKMSSHNNDLETFSSVLTEGAGVDQYPLNTTRANRDDKIDHDHDYLVALFAASKEKKEHGDNIATTKYNYFHRIDNEHKSHPDVLSGIFEEAIEEYASWNVRWHSAKQDYRDLPRLTNTLKHINVLDRADITCRDTEFENRVLVKAWLCGSRSMNFKTVSKEFTTILSSAAKSVPALTSCI